MELLTLITKLEKVYLSVQLLLQTFIFKTIDNLKGGTRTPLFAGTLFTMTQTSFQ